MRLLIIGASGYLGNTIYHKLKESTNNDVYGTCYSSGNPEFLPINVLDRVDIEKLFSLKPDMIVWCVMDPKQECLVSKIGLNEIANHISKEVRLIYVSTTVGIGKDQTETVVPHKRSPEEYLSQYINGKIEGETIVKKHPNHVIIRPGSIYGYDYYGIMDSRMKTLLEISKTGENYSRTSNLYGSFVNVQDLANAIIEIAFGAYCGILNISGEHPVSYYEFNRFLAKLMNFDNSFIVPDYRPEAVYHHLNNEKRKAFLNTVIREICL